MSASTSIARAEKRALAGDNESQDSQDVLDAYMKLYGVGLTSSSPAEDDRAPFQKYHKLARKASQEQGSRKKGRKSHCKHSARPGTAPLEYAEERNATINDREDTRPSPVDISKQGCHSDEQLSAKGQDPSGRSPKDSIGKSAVDNAKPCALGGPKPSVQPDARMSIPLQSGPSVGVTKTMDSSQSPTQSNDGRSYEQYFHKPSQGDKTAAPLGEQEKAIETLSQSSAYEQKSLSEDDTGAVVFDIDNHAATHSDNVLTSDPSPELDRSLSRHQNFPSHQHTSYSQDQLPETPAVRQNPFAGKNQFQLLPTSQLFKATQFSSALRRGASPTSSRPSPNDFPHNTLSPNSLSSPSKDRGIRTSPWTARTSSPQVPHSTDSPHVLDEETTPFNMASKKERPIPQSPRYRPSKTKGISTPMDVYVPMRESQERRSSSVALQGTESPELSDHDGEDPMDRRRRARSKKEASLKRLTSIQFTRTPKADDVEVPSTNNKKRKLRAQAHEYISQCYGKERLNDDDPEFQEMVENSQNQLTMEECHGPEDQASTQSIHDEDVTPSEDDITASSAAAGRHSPKRRRRNDPHICGADINLANGETIPETSPVEKQSDHYRDIPGATPRTFPRPSSDSVVVGSLRSLDNLTNVPKSSVTEYVPGATASGESTGNGSDPSSQIVVSSSRDQAVPRGGKGSWPVLPGTNHDRAPALGSSPPAPAFSTRSKTRLQHSTQRQELAIMPSRELPQRSTSMSTLSTLSSTPSMTTSTTAPGSQEFRVTRLPQADAEEKANSSPVVAKHKRRPVHDLPRLKTGSSTESLRASTRLSRQRRLDSTDELAKSPSMTPTFEQSLCVPPRSTTSRLLRASTNDIQLAQDPSHRRPGKLFEGMAFGISFQAKKLGESSDQYTKRMDAAKNLASKIIQAGGKVLAGAGGFEELFEFGHVKSATTSPVSRASSSPLQAAEGEVNLTPAARHIGFAALVADGHSRKAKYMQALALGLPCIAPRWITTCLERDEIVDWAPYLLCAGQSAFLGGAYRSRNLIPYDAVHARLAEVIEARPRLLDGSKVLIVMKKSEQAKKKEYVFLARVLGATLIPAYSVEEARVKMKTWHDLGQPFDWVYVGDKVDKAELFMDAGTDAARSNKKRKRGGKDSTATAGPPLKKIRSLTDELVIQSLILGRLIEDGEMEE